MLRKTLLSLATVSIALGTIQVASAADLPARPVYKEPLYTPAWSWTGVYIGINGGFGGDKVRYPFSAPTIPVTGEASVTSSGFFAGGQIGYNYQWANNWVVGLEADIQWSNIESELAASAATPGGALSLNAGTELKWYGTVRGRFGYAWDRLFLYGTGGFAYGSTTTTLNASGFGGDVAFSHDNTKVGWTAGGGLEYAITRNVSFKTEYLYLDLGTDNVTSSAFGFPITIDEHTTAHTIKAGLNWKFM
jgi:outer membrane immunogenic protein